MQLPIQLKVPVLSDESLRLLFLHRKIQPERVSLLCLWLYTSSSQKKHMWCLNTWDTPWAQGGTDEHEGSRTCSCIAKSATTWILQDIIA